MALAIALATGTLFAAGVYLMLRRNLVKVVLGLSLVSNAVNLIVFTAAGLVPGVPPLIAQGQTVLVGTTADPLPQALVLTSIVITFGVQAFALVLVYVVHDRLGTDDPDQLTVGEAMRAFEGGWI